jgi:hypothetical protein
MTAATKSSFENTLRGAADAAEAHRIRSEAYPPKYIWHRVSQGQQECAVCGDATDRCSDDARFVGDVGPLCSICCAELESK